MLNLFPIQFLAPIAYLLLRVCVGVIFLYYARLHIKNRGALAPLLRFSFLGTGSFLVWYIALAEIIIGVLFILGLYTQVAALASIAFMIKMGIFKKHFDNAFFPRRGFRMLILFSSLSLFITGAGILAFDLPI